jgi:hypothetical protein
MWIFVRLNLSLAIRVLLTPWAHKKILFPAARATETPDLQNPHTRVIFVIRDLVENKRKTNEQWICEGIPSSSHPVPPISSGA